MREGKVVLKEAITMPVFATLSFFSWRTLPFSGTFFYAAGAELFKRDKSVISRHINNIFKEEELDRNSTVANFATVQNESGRTVTRNIDYYNLDVIISVGYRVKSKEGTKFRIWATKILKDYMLKGYAVNQKRLEYLEKTIKLIDIANRMEERLDNSDAKEILKVIGDYSKALDLLDDYDHKTLKNIK